MFLGVGSNQGTRMALQSQLFRGDSKLEAAAVSDPAHIFQARVGRTSARSRRRCSSWMARSSPKMELWSRHRGSGRAFKQKRQILNTQGKIDNIVGKKTMAALDSEMLALERVAPPPSPGRAGVRQGVNTVGGGTPTILGAPLDIFVQFAGRPWQSGRDCRYSGSVSVRCQNKHPCLPCNAFARASDHLQRRDRQ